MNVSANSRGEKKLGGSFYSSFMARNGLMGEEIDLLQGKVSKSVFARYYLKENIEF